MFSNGATAEREIAISMHEAAMGKYARGWASTQRLAGYLLLPLMTALVGCGSRAESTVSGLVTLGGSALDHGQVVFVPVTGGGGQGATGQIESNGSYTVQVGQTGGLPAGEYKVVVLSQAPSVPRATPGAPPLPGKLLTPERYRQATTTELQFVVEPGSNKINLELLSK
jgi:hypothetical protein